jgi:hypothetical protein
MRTASKVIAVALEATNADGDKVEIQHMNLTPEDAVIYAGVYGVQLIGKQLYTYIEQRAYAIEKESYPKTLTVKDQRVINAYGEVCHWHLLVKRIKE